jgi:hypothetical protein
MPDLVHSGGEERQRDLRKTILLPASVGIAVLLACVVALLAALAAAPAASAASGNGASFAVRCDFSHRAADDPIVHPNNPGAAHSHDFFGNKTTNADPTYENMLEKATTCTRLEDTAAYWIPTVKWNGQDLTSNRAVFYYRAGGKDHTTVKPFDKNLKVITERVRWDCGTDDGKEGSQDPPKQCKSGVLGVRIVFPDCVAKDSSGGQVTDSTLIDPTDTSHRSHMARSVLQSDGSRRCPDAHPIPVPTLTVNANFPIPKASGTVTVSSDHQGDPPGSTMHSDFWNTWNQAELERLVVGCINNVPPSDPRPEQCRAPTATA